MSLDSEYPDECTHNSVNTDTASSPFKCPKCGGPYFGVDPVTGIVACHCADDGSHLDATPDKIWERRQAGLPRQKMCKWVGKYEFNELDKQPPNVAGNLTMNSTQQSRKAFFKDLFETYLRRLRACQHAGEAKYKKLESVTVGGKSYTAYYSEPTNWWFFFRHGKYYGPFTKGSVSTFIGECEFDIHYGKNFNNQVDVHRTLRSNPNS